jgi:hypothetical protein
MFCQGIELVFPEGAVPLNPGGGILHGLGSQAAAVEAAVDFAAEQAGGLQHAEVLGDSRERDVEGRGELGDGGSALGEARENGAARGIGESAEGGVERRAGIVNHVV